MVELSRVDTTFQAPGEVGEARSLDDPYLSRNPITIKSDRTGVELRMPGQATVQDQMPRSTHSAKGATVKRANARDHLL